VFAKLGGGAPQDELDVAPAAPDSDAASLSLEAIAAQADDAVEAVEVALAAQRAVVPNREAVAAVPAASETSSAPSAAADGDEPSSLSA